jgi:hypothetical protein
MNRTALLVRADCHACYLQPKRDRCAKPIAESFAHLSPRRTAETGQASSPKSIARQTNNASPGKVFVTPPRRNSDNFASPPLTNLQPANNVQPVREAKFAEFRLTRKKKNIAEAKINASAE